MNSHGIARRVAALESRTSGGFKAWHRVFQEVGQTEEEAIAAYEAENGPLGDYPNFIVRIICNVPAKGEPPASPRGQFLN